MLLTSIWFAALKLPIASNLAFKKLCVCGQGDVVVETDIIEVDDVTVDVVVTTMMRRWCHSHRWCWFVDVVISFNVVPIATFASFISVTSFRVRRCQYEKREDGVGTEQKKFLLKITKPFHDLPNVKSLVECGLQLIALFVNKLARVYQGAVVVAQLVEQLLTPSMLVKLEVCQKVFLSFMKLVCNKYVWLSWIPFDRWHRQVVGVSSVTR